MVKHQSEGLTWSLLALFLSDSGGDGDGQYSEKSTLDSIPACDLLGVFNNGPHDEPTLDVAHASRPSVAHEDPILRDYYFYNCVLIAPQLTEVRRRSAPPPPLTGFVHSPRSPENATFRIGNSARDGEHPLDASNILPVRSWQSGARPRLAISLFVSSSPTTQPYPRRPSQSNWGRGRVNRGQRAHQ